MKITQLKGNPLYFSSKTAGDKPQKFTIQAVEVRPVNESDRVVLILEGEERELKLSARQVSLLSRFWGDETDDWKGKVVEVSRGETDGVEVMPVIDDKSGK